MGTRALFSFYDRSNHNGPVNVFMHYDGYPEGAVEALMNAKALAWDFPRFEPDEFAAAFIAANKDRSGNFRIMPSGKPSDIAIRFCSDIEFRYEIGPCLTTSPWVSGYAIEAFAHYRERHLFSGSLESLSRYPERLSEAA